ncbi:MAG: spiro-SPASM protein [Alkalispirochaeta sp.]
MDYLVLHAPRLSRYLEHPFPDGSTALDHIARRVELLRPMLSSTAPVYVLSAEAPGGTAVPESWNIVVVTSEDSTSPSSAAAFRALDESLPREEGSVLVSALDAPFFDVALARYLYILHRHAWCDYTFGDGFPVGYSVEVLRRGILPSLAQLAEAGDQRWTRSFVFDALSSDINAFDVETEAATEDLAMLRLSLTVDTQANFLLCRRLVERGVANPSDPSDAPDPSRERYDHLNVPLLSTVRDDPSLGRTLPYYYQIQVTDELSQRPTYLPWNDPVLGAQEPGSGNFLAPGDWDRLISQIAEVTPEAVLSIGYRGEPGLHQDLPHLVQTVEQYPALQLYVETSGIGWTERNIEALDSSAVQAVIVELDTIDPERYLELRGEGLTEASEFIERIRRIIPGKVFVQATRLKETEWELQSFFHHWDKVDGVKPLIQKYNSWAGRLPDRSVVEGPPLHRIPCWHLQRDMVILMDGSVPRCFQDLPIEEYRGNVFSDGVEAVWRRGAEEHADHARGTLAPICERCDEYYTFNA